jgi:hypothetical protein
VFCWALSEVFITHILVLICITSAIGLLEVKADIDNSKEFEL